MADLPAVGRRKSQKEERLERLSSPSEETEEHHEDFKVYSSYFADRTHPPTSPGEEIKLQSFAGEQEGGSKPRLAGRQEKQMFWWYLVESAAASEVAVNLLLPCMVCSRRSGTWQPPPEWVLLLLTLMLNLGGTFLEGFFKSTRLLSQSIRRSQKDHLLVFVTAEAFSAGFLSVATSFPGVSGSASGIPLGLNSLWFGAFFSLFNMILGLAFYLWGARIGRLCFRRQWAAVVRFSEAWQKVACAVVLAAVFVPMLAAPIFGGPQGKASSWLPPLPLDMAEPELRPSLVLRIPYRDWVLWECPPFALGLLCGILMSVAGAALATFFCGEFFSGGERPAARLFANVAASVLAYTARAIDAAVDCAEGKSAISGTSDFLRSKFVSSFCGALSAFSGTIGDIADVQFGSAAEDSILDSSTHEVPSKRRSQLQDISRMPGLYNFLLHWVLTLLVMWGCARFETWPRAVSIPTASPIPLQRKPWVRSRSVVRWGSLVPDSETEV